MPPPVQESNLSSIIIREGENPLFTVSFTIFFRLVAKGGEGRVRVMEINESRHERKLESLPEPSPARSSSSGNRRAICRAAAISAFEEGRDDVVSSPAYGRASVGYISAVEGARVQGGGGEGGIKFRGSRCVGRRCVRARGCASTPARVVMFTFDINFPPMFAESLARFVALF